MSDKIRVLHAYRTYFPDPPGGLQEAIRQVALATQAFGVESRVFTLSPNPDPVEVQRPEALVMRARSWAAPASCDLGLSEAFRRFAAQVKWADIVHYHFPWPFADLLQFLANPSKPCIMTYHSDVVGKGWLEHLYRPLMRRMLGRMDAVAASSPAYVESSPVLRMQIKPERLRVIPLGISQDSYGQYLQDAEDIDLKLRFGLKEEGYFVFIGVLRAYKGLHTLIEAAALLGLPVVIAGTGRDESRLRLLAAPHGNIHFLGPVTNSEKMALIQRSRAMVLPSHLRSEAFGMVLVESAMCGKPMISCEIGTGTSFVNANEETGFVVKPESPRELATAMETLAAKNGVAEQMGKAARARYERLFSGEALGRSYVDLYREVLGA